MDWKTPRSTWHLAVAAVLALVLGVTTLTAQQNSQPAGGDALQEKVAELSALSPEARRAELRKMSAEERRGLWFELKRSAALPDGAPADSRATYRRPVPPAAAGATGLEAAPVAAPPERLIGSITYDDGAFTASFGGGAIIGNRFDSANGDPLLASGTISSVVGVMVPGPANTTSSAGFVIEGPQTGGGGAMALFSTFTNGLTGTQETVVFSGLGVNYPGSSFFVLFGDFASVYVPAFGTGTTQGQGHHGVVGYTGGMGPNITGTFNFGDALNALIRVTGNVLPVELMSFEVDGQ